jgi:phosphoglycerate kinase
MSQKRRVAKSIRDFRLKNRKVFIRLDLNAPLSEPDADGKRTVTDDTRIVEALPTIQYAIEQEAKVILASHLGRPKGKPSTEFSLEPIAEVLAEKLGTDVTLLEDVTGDGIDLMIQSMSGGQVFLLENLRFDAGEEENAPALVKRLAKITDVFVTDAFGTSHRKHASTYGLPEQVSERAIGFLIEKELKYLDRLLHETPRPFFTVLGGSKVSDKIKTIEALLSRVDGLLVGGAMAYAFYPAAGREIPKEAKQPSEEDIRAANSITKDAKRREVEIVLPIDTKDCFDIGTATIATFKDRLRTARTIFWNGPVGWFEKPEYAQGTNELAKFIAELGALKIVGGGDTVAAIKQSGFADRFDHLSTGGGAVLKYLEGKGLPGIEVIKTDTLRTQNPEYGYEEPRKIEVPGSSSDSQE